MTVPRQDRSWSKRTDRSDFDHIVVGSGMGGMTAAAMLASLGHRVLVLEQHYTPGGFTHAFRRQGFSWDVGVHAVGEVSHHSLTGRLLARLTGGRLQWASLGAVYEEFHFPDGLRIDYPDHPEAFREALVRAFPSEAPAIDAYLGRVREVARAMKGYYQARALPRALAGVGSFLLARKAQAAFEQNTRDVIHGLTDDPRLRTVLAARWGYYGSPPSRSSFAIQALVDKHFQHGAFYPVGGSSRIAVELLRTVAEAGGWTRICAEVDSILVEGRRAVGVRLADGEEIRARQGVISAVGAVATARRLLPEGAAPREWVDALAPLPSASAHVCLNLGFQGDIAKTGCSGANQWFFETWDLEQEFWDVHPDRAVGRAPLLYCSYPSLKDPDHDPGPEQRHTGEVVTFVPWESFTRWQGTTWRQRGEGYETFKRTLHDALLAQFLDHRPELEPLIAHSEISTPLSTDTFVRPMRGSIYGVEPTPERFRNPHLRPATPIKGLYLAGSEVATVGVIGAMMGGVLAVMAAEPRGALRLLRTA
jgi:all-trans-retinol 13,14-reductase